MCDIGPSGVDLIRVIDLLNAGYKYILTFEYRKIRTEITLIPPYKAAPTLHSYIKGFLDPKDDGTVELIYRMKSINFTIKETNNNGR